MNAEAGDGYDSVQKFESVKFAFDRMSPLVTLNSALNFIQINRLNVQFTLKFCVIKKNPIK